MNKNSSDPKETLRKTSKDMIDPSLPENLKKLMLEYLLPDNIHQNILSQIKLEYYRGKTPELNHKIMIILGQTGSGKSNLTEKVLKQNKNSVIIDPDKYKILRPDNEKILKEHMAEYSYLTRPDSYLHRDEMMLDTMKLGYNILIECAPSQKHGLFLDVNELKSYGYEIEIHVLAVSYLNSALSIHERYEQQIIENYSCPKLTELKRHDESFIAVKTCLENLQNDENIKIFIYERGMGFPYEPNLVFSSQQNEVVDNNRFITSVNIINNKSPVEIANIMQMKDRNSTFKNFVERYIKIKERMIKRKAPLIQMKQLKTIKKRFIAMLYKI